MFENIKKTQFTMNILAILHMEEVSLSIRISNIATYSRARNHLRRDLSQIMKATKVLERYKDLL